MPDASRRPAAALPDPPALSDPAALPDPPATAEPVAAGLPAERADLARWGAVAELIDWQRRPDALYRPSGSYGEWFAGGTLNLAVNCVDRHLATRAGQPAIHWEGEPGDRRTLSYRQLHEEVLALAAALRGLGVGAGDRVALHLGWLPETVVAMLACARIGALFTVLPMPLPVEALAERLDDVRPKLLITQDGAWRHGTIIPAKARADEALTAVHGVEHTVVVRRTGLDVAWYEGDRWLHDLVAQSRPGTPPPDASPAELPSAHPLLAVNLANRRGRPVAVVHGTASSLALAIALHRYALSPGGVFWLAGDISWLAAQVHGVIGPLAWGETTVMFEGTLDVPTHHRLWELVERYGVATLTTTPSVLDRVRGWSDAPPPAPVRRTLRRVIAVSEPFEPALRAWVASSVLASPPDGSGPATVADAWGQIELGGVVTVDNPLDPDRMPDAGLVVVDADGAAVPDGTPGELVMSRPWAGTLRAVEGAGAPDTDHHWHRPSVYSTGDRAVRRPGGRLEFLGRIDDVVNLSGQLVSLSEVRDVLLEHPFVADAEVVVRADARTVVACVVPAAGTQPDAALAGELVEAVRETLGGLARPRTVLFVERFGDELATDVRRRALAAVAGAASAGGLTAPVVTWRQVLAAAAVDDVS
ncbi:MAG: AMP-binding protein [Micromonosporaceae bacterium]